MSLGKALYWGIAGATLPVSALVVAAVEIAKRTSLRAVAYTALTLGTLALTPAAIGVFSADVCGHRRF